MPSMWFLRMLLAAAVASAPLSAQTLLVLQKGTSSLGFYTMEGKLQESIEVGPHPDDFVVSDARGLAFVSNNGLFPGDKAAKPGETVTIVDIRGRRRLGEIELYRVKTPGVIDYDSLSRRLAVTTSDKPGLAMLEEGERRFLRRFDSGGDVPGYVSFGPNTGSAQWAYVSYPDSGKVVAIQLATGETKDIPTGAGAAGSALSADGSRLYVADEEANTVVVIDTERKAAISQIRTGLGPSRIAALPGGRYLAYTLRGDRKLEIADLATYAPDAQVDLMTEPSSLSLSPDGELAIVTSSEDDKVLIVSLKERRVVRSFEVARGSFPVDAAAFTLP
jgi:YVTN family beta-propeller protein